MGVIVGLGMEWVGEGEVGSLVWGGKRCGWGAAVWGCRGDAVGWDWALGFIVGLGLEQVGEGEVDAMGVGGMVGEV